MGGQTSKQRWIDIPELYYLHRKKKTVLHLTNLKITKLKFSKNLKIRKDSAVGYMPNRKIMVCGGTDSSYCFTNKVLIINPIKLKTKQASLLPVSCKLGYLIEYHNWMYFAGGLCECYNEDDETEAPAKLMRYNIRENYWEVFPDGKNEAKDSEKNEKKQDLDQNKTKITDLYLPSVFYHNGKLYFVGGKLRKNEDFKENWKFFTINIANEEFELYEERFKLPVKVNNVVCISRSSDVLIAGGYFKEEFNKNCWSLSFIKGKAEFSQEPGFICDYIDSHPVVYTGLVTVFFAFPDVLMLKNDWPQWEKVTLIQKQQAPNPELNKILLVDSKPRNKSTIIVGKDPKFTKKKTIVKKDSESEEEKINPFPNLESLKLQKKAPFDENIDDSSSTD